MSTQNRELNFTFGAWPANKKEDNAREVFGQHLVYSFDSWLKIAENMLFRGYRHKSPSTVQFQYFEWIARLSPEDRLHCRTFVEAMMRGVIFDVLNSFDGTSGAVLEGEYMERIQLALAITRRETDEPVETIPLNAEEGIEFHELWYEWLERYSERATPLEELMARQEFAE